MLEKLLNDILLPAEAFIWGWPMLILLLGVGIYLGFLLRWVQFFKLPQAIKRALPTKKNNHGDGDISHFEALMTALSATVGTGNIAGVATAVVAGGPGAIFWMWMSGLLGMGTKYTEALLGVHFRIRNKRGERDGGPMYYIRDGLNMPLMASFFALAMIIGAFTVGNMIQSNSIVTGLHTALAIPEETITKDAFMLGTGIIIMMVAGIVMLGGVKRIAHTASAIVPFMILLYLAAGSFILIENSDKLLGILGTIFSEGILSVQALIGGAVGEMVRSGLSRGVFSNESGMGSAPIAAAAAKTDHPVMQAKVSMTQTFIDTIIVCTFTALIILCTGLGSSGLNGAPLTTEAFTQGLGIQVSGYNLGGLVVALSLTFFAFSTIIGWGLYGEKSVIFVFGERAVFAYRTIYVGVILVGASLKLETVWSLGAIAVGLMVVPNVIALFMLAPKARALTKDYFKHQQDGKYEVKPFFHE